ncbi:MAG: hypothetical protein ACM3PY_04150 [Omnitrophica WOR_2 bacterium]
MKTVEPTRQERLVLRRLAEQVAEIACLPIQAERARLWQAMNNLKPERPLVLANPENGWCELVPDASLECQHPLLREWERALRRQVFRHEAIHDDWPVTGWFNVYWVVDVGGYGLQETQVRSEERGSYTWDPPIKSTGDLEKLHPREITVDHTQTAEHVALAEDVLGDLLNVRRFGEALCRAKLTRVLIHLRGLQQMMLDMYDNPRLMHELMAFLRDDFLHEWQVYEREGVLTLNNQPDSLLGSGSLGHTSLLPSGDFDGQVRMQDMWCWGESQETVGVSPQQFDEFVLQYQLPLMNRFGLVDYGCCEPLDNKLDLLIRHIPRLRSVAVSPWCNRKIAAEKLGNRYVYVWKPNPSYICSPQADFETAGKDIRETLEIANGCCLVIVLKDTSTFQDEPGRITRWTDLASRLVSG